MSREVLVAVVVTLIVNEAIDISPWTAIRLVRWAAKHIYAGNTERAARRAEEWEAVIDESIPTKVSKLFFGLGFGCAGLYCITIRYLPKILATLWRRIRPRRPSMDTIEGWKYLAVGMVFLALPDLVQLIVLGSVIVLLVCGAGVMWILEQVRGARGAPTARTSDAVK
jgi:hypothetical protein